MDKPRFLWDVKHPEYEPVLVEAPDRLHAVAEAAHAWGGTEWTSVARGCEVRKIGPAPAKKLPQKKSRQRRKREENGSQPKPDGTGENSTGTRRALRRRHEPSQN